MVYTSDVCVCVCMCVCVCVCVCVRGRGRGQGRQAFSDMMSFFTSNEPIFQFFSPTSHLFVGEYFLVLLDHVTATLADEREAVMD